MPSFKNLDMLVKKSRTASIKSGKGFFSQLIELVCLRFGNSKLGADDYYLYQLYDDHRYTFQEKTEFVGWRVSAKLDQILNANQWRVYANDKVEFAKVMKAAGMRTPMIVSLYTEGEKQLEDMHMLRNFEEVIRFLCNPDVYPLFIKPVHGTYGKGAFSALSIDENMEHIELGDGSYRSIEEVVNQFAEKWAQGYILQQLLYPHPEVEALIGSRLSSLRIIVLLTDDGPHIFRAVWKLPTGRNMSDNFMHGELGNLIAHVDIEQGKINNAVGMCNGKIVVVPQHPDTGTSLTDLVVPLWSEVVDFCLEAAPLFPGLAMQHWDIAICPVGPVALELNVEGAMDLHQLAGFSGVYDATLRALVKKSVSNS